jgi:hypothetical protein
VVTQQRYEPLEIQGSWDSYFYKFLGVEPPYFLNGSMVLAHPHDACSPLTNGNFVKGKLVAVTSENCRPSVKAKHVQDVGGVAMLVFNDVRYWLPDAFREQDPHGVHIPVLDLAHNEGTVDLFPLKNYFLAHPDVVASVTVSPRM